MLQMRYSTQHFPHHFKLKDGWHDLHFGWADVLHAALTVGRKSWDWVMQYSNYSINEMSFRINMIEAFLCVRGNSVVRTPAFANLDPSEKTAISYFLGLVGAKLITHKKFDVPWLMHVDVYVNASAGTDRITIKKWREDSNERPDLIGINKRGEWIVTEAKGRQNHVSSALDKAKQQTLNLKKIDGEYPVLRFGMLTYFKNEIWTSDLVDPYEFIETAPNLDISKGQFFKDYYAPIFALLKSRGELLELNEDGFYTAQLPNTKLIIGLDSSIYNVMNGALLEQKESSPDRLWKTITLFSNLYKFNDRDDDNKSIFESLMDENEYENKNRYFIGHDGIMVGILE
ncbi:hypothetical protein CA600_05485 [Paenibacillus sp. VTT E-133280]|uniref:hypothetical protein n=1 Tax=Paenibacillus sp. VTT E-133280 TaxID=1986222 RepID=UPI000BA0AF7E|nr:hypothetical protein [Paenibacillus sp. VTT E-133280]OZQ68873.1 hypothetical protein CA600_05485 [Paenibacillus sp. VTT E-133280]